MNNLPKIGKASVFIGSLFLVSSCGFFNFDDDTVSDSRKSSVEGVFEEVKRKEAKTTSDLSSLTLSVHLVKKNSSVFGTLISAGLSGKQANSLVESAKEFYDLSMVKPNSQFSFYWEDEAKSNIKYIKYKVSPVKTLSLVFLSEHETWLAELEQKNIETELRIFQSTVETSLWNSANTAGISPSIISSLSEIFAWQIDFSREVRKGDKWRITVEELTVDGAPYKWGNVLAAEYINHGESFVAIRYQTENKKSSYYTPEGDSLKRIFLKSPVRFSRISSGFTRKRFHPILKVNKPHRGVDYAASRGTPVRAVGDGKVVHATYQRASGKVVKIKHNSVYSTSYHHLSKFARGLKSGKKVTQGDIIGYVGSTGLATGPHLHFAFYENGRYVDPLGLKFPSADPIPENQLNAYKSEAKLTLATLPSWKYQTPEILSSTIKDKFSSEKAH